MFTNKAKLTALSICHIFETGEALGEATTVAVLPDKAGISYGIPQATHKSGNLLDIVERYIASSDEVLYEPFLRKYIPALRKTDQRTVDATARDSELKRVLREVGDEPQMIKAQLANIDERMGKAVRICAGSGFKTPMALAVVYDSLNHGSYDTVRDKVSGNLSEKSWIKAYCLARKNWLANHKRTILHSTVYRPNFFLQQIAADNWDLNVPMKVHGFTLKASHLAEAEQQLRDIDDKQGANYEAHSENEEAATSEETKNEEQQSSSSSEAVEANATNATDKANADATASVVVESGEKAKVDAAENSDAVTITGTPPVNLWGKISAGVTAILTGAWVIPKFDLSEGQLKIVEMIFPYLMVGLLIALPAWYAVKKYNNYQLTKLKATINADTTLKDVIIKPFVQEDTWAAWFKRNAAWIIVGLLLVVNLIAILVK